MYDPEGETPETPFVGRTEERAEIKTRVGEGERVLLLYGQPMVGKARLASQVAKDVCDESSAAGKQRPTVYTADCKAAADWPDVTTALCSAFSFDETHTVETQLLDAIGRGVGVTGKPAGEVKHGAGRGERTKCEVGETRVILVLLKLNNIHPKHEERLTRFLNALVNYGVITIVTSRRRLRVKCVMEVKAMTYADVRLLLSQEAPDIKVQDFVDVLKYCRGLPPLVMQMAQLVSGDPVTVFKAEELKQQLEENPKMLMEGLEPEAENLFSGLSHVVQSHVTTLGQLLDGTFSLEALHAALGVEGARSKTVIRRLCEEHTVVVEPDSDSNSEKQSRRLQMNPFILHHVRKMGHMEADDQARLRVVTLLGRALARAEHELYLADQDTVYGQVQGDWPQLQHMLRHAIHCTQDTYRAYFKVATDAGTLLLRCYPEESVIFFRSMANVAEQFGTQYERGVLKGFVGMARTHTRDMSGWQEAFDCFGEALVELRKEEHKGSPALPRLLAYIGSAYYRRSQFHVSERYFREAIEACAHTRAEPERVVFLVAQIRSLMSLPIVDTGRFDAGKELVQESLDLCAVHCPRHYQVPVLINTLGMIHAHAGEDQSALDCYERSLAERRRFATVAPRDLVSPLNNMAVVHLKNDRYDRTLVCLAEAESIMTGLRHYQGACTYNITGQVYLKRGEYKLAEKYFLQAAEVFSVSTPGHIDQAEVILFLAHVSLTPPCFDTTQVKKYLREVCEMCEASRDDLTETGLLMAMSAVQHRWQLDGWRVREDPDLLDWALQRLEKFRGELSDDVVQHRNLLQRIAHFDRNTPEEEKREVTSRVLDTCRACRMLAPKVDAPSLWKEVERAIKSKKSAISSMLDSFALQAILKEPITSELQQSGQTTGAIPKKFPRGGQLPASACTSDEQPRENSHDVNRSSNLSSPNLSGDGHLASTPHRDIVNVNYTFNIRNSAQSVAFQINLPSPQEHGNVDTEASSISPNISPPISGEMFGETEWKPGQSDARGQHPQRPFTQGGPVNPLVHADAGAVQSTMVRQLEQPLQRLLSHTEEPQQERRLRQCESAIHRYQPFQKREGILQVTQPVDVVEEPASLLQADDAAAAREDELGDDVVFCPADQCSEDAFSFLASDSVLQADDASLHIAHEEPQDDAVFSPAVQCSDPAFRFPPSDNETL